MASRYPACDRTGGGCPGAAADATAWPGADQRWQRFQSPHFDLYSSENDATSRGILEHFELLRAVFLARSRLAERAPLDVTIYCFRRERDFRAYLPGGRTIRGWRGYHLACADRAIIALFGGDGRDGTRHVAYHEYIHHLIRSAGLKPALWLAEGLAELYASARLEDGMLEFGRAHRGRVAVLQRSKLLPLPELFAVDQDSPHFQSADHVGLFYAQSWALLHYWHHGQSDLPRVGVSRFIQRSMEAPSAGTDAGWSAWFEECFGMDYAQMERRLETYVSSGTYRTARQPAPEIAPPKSHPSRLLATSEIQIALAGLALRATQSAAARLELLLEVERRPNDPRLWEVLGADALAEGEAERAQEHWERALAAGSRNPAVLRGLGMLELRQWLEEIEFEQRLPAEVVDRVRQRLQVSLAEAPQQSASYELLAWVEAFAPEPSIRNLELVQQQFATLLEKERTLVALALARIRLGMPEEARRVLNQLPKLQPDEWADYAADVLRARLDGNEPPSDARAEITDELSPTIGRVTRTRLIVPSVTLPDNLLSGSGTAPPAR